jgi:hypothetical protein
VISSDEARNEARTRVCDPALRGDPLFAPWPDATIGNPVMVRTLQGEPSYRLVPVELQGRVAGFVRVNIDGKVAAVGAHYRDARHIAASPRVVTHILTPPPAGRPGMCAPRVVKRPHRRCTCTTALPAARHG